GFGDGVAADRRPHGRADAAPRREVPQWRRDDGRGRGLHLRAGADVRQAGGGGRPEAVHRRRRRRYQGPAAGSDGGRPPLLAVAGPRRGGRQVHGPLRQQAAGRDAGRPHRPGGRADHLAPRLHGIEELAGMGAQAHREGSLPDRRVPPRRVADAGGVRRVLGRPPADQAAPLRRRAGSGQPHQRPLLGPVRLRHRHPARP
ncbi:Uncharacterized protein APZ42_003041, partial [Daphnia magna]